MAKAWPVQRYRDALRPSRSPAGRFAFTIFALGIIGTGLLALPVPTGSAAYAAGWIGAASGPRAFYGTIAGAT
jgi:hypothetical protein